MQVKVFEAEDMPSALKQVKEAMGQEALIISTRTVRKGGLGLLGKPILEVTAAMESSAPLSQIPAAPAAPVMKAPADNLTYEDVWRKRKVIDPLEEEIQEIRGHLSTLKVDELQNEINELKSMVKDAVVTGQGGSEVLPQPGPKNDLASRMRKVLLSRGVQAQVAKTVIRQAMSKYPPKVKTVTLAGFLAAAIADLVQTGGGIGKSQKDQKRVALVGPTGVGKTTTIAKLAADYILSGGRSLALVTVDIYRIAAAEQLKVYGEIMKVPVEVVLSADQLEKVFEKHKDKELILIDTAGRSPRDRAGLEELLGILGPGSQVENHLVLSATTRAEELHGAVKRFGVLPIQNVIFSKLDECESCGGILDVHLRHKYPISYLTNGQRVPEDLLLADPGKMAKVIMKKPVGDK